MRTKEGDTERHRKRKMLESDMEKRTERDMQLYK